MHAIAGLFIIVATIMGQIILYSMVQKIVPEYLIMYVLVIVFTWIGLFAKALGD